MFAKPEPFTLLTLILIGEIIALIEQLALLHRIGDPPGLENIPLEEVLWGQGVIDGLQLISETLVEFRENSSIFLYDYAEFTLLFVLCALV